MNNIDETIRSITLDVLSKGDKIDGKNVLESVRLPSILPHVSARSNAEARKAAVLDSLRGVGAFGSMARIADDRITHAIEAIKTGATFAPIRGAQFDVPLAGIYLDLIDMAYVQADKTQVSLSIVCGKVDCVTELADLVSEAAILLHLLAGESGRVPVSIEVFCARITVSKVDGTTALAIVQDPRKSQSIHVPTMKGIDNYKAADIRIA